ncbi:O-sialoglycoprotein endopeptidase [Thermaerobacter marianensis DSM 12885]|uniref:tRNA N6-adenosine threonylcarbamoyltransferase n=1 Tax=Thermaerobacter marianensis (strain ATCC 700841 / DSM 12885 / JCM 10246 / 7p75a) TaxID=644966 RepID=E6SM64_THEM7|nr:tRNA (adenosine(37)-N6)-threonylcarbamoyltransferase complex transferase subunit TsaD [Thermaerobacter marianensis]ADU50394.1 O-sialoglycoprotein endopeptidase [Thermaerobacter marianensis DSM 12885]
MSRPHLTLGIETSCDETSFAVVAGGRRILANVVLSQTGEHRRYGGVVPELASRRHVTNAVPLLQAALAEAGIGLGDLDLIAVTRGPGLVGALLVGVSLAKALAWALDKPLVGVHHLAGHVYANFLAPPGGDTAPEPRYPAVTLVVSGGHTDLFHLEAGGGLRWLGGTRDDAAGEAFDKVARELGLGYPGGPVIDRLAAQGDPGAFAFPRAMLDDDTLDFSFSGLKTAVLYELERRGWRDPDRRAELEAHLPDLAASFQQAVVDVLVAKTLRAARQVGARQIYLAGGVAANRRLRHDLGVAAAAAGLDLAYPPPVLCTDNGAMIAAAGFAAWQRGRRDGLDLDVDPDPPLDEWF